MWYPGPLYPGPTLTFATCDLVAKVDVGDREMINGVETTTKNLLASRSKRHFAIIIANSKKSETTRIGIIPLNMYGAKSGLEALTRHHLHRGTLFINLDEVSMDNYSRLLASVTSSGCEAF